MIDTQSPTFLRSLRASSTPIATRPTSSLVLRGVVAGSGQLAGRARSSMLPCTSVRFRSSAPSRRSMPLRLAPTRPIITSPGENTNGAMRTTLGMPASRRWMSASSSKSASPYACTMRCAFSASTLFWNSRSKPLVTANTTTSAATPSTTPIVETVVNTENARSRKATTMTRPPTRMPTIPAVSMPRARPCAASEHHDAGRHQRAADGQRVRRPARTAAAMQVTEADQPLQVVGEELGQRPPEQQRHVHRDQRPQVAGMDHRRGGDHDGRYEHHQAGRRPGPPLRTISTVPHAITTASPSAPITQPPPGFQHGGRVDAADQQQQGDADDDAADRGIRRQRRRKRSRGPGYRSDGGRHTSAVTLAASLTPFDAKPYRTRQWPFPRCGVGLTSFASSGSPPS